MSVEFRPAPLERPLFASFALLARGQTRPAFLIKKASIDIEAGTY